MDFDFDKYFPMFEKWLKNSVEVDEYDGMSIIRDDIPEKFKDDADKLMETHKKKILLHCIFSIPEFNPGFCAMNGLKNQLHGRLPVEDDNIRLVFLKGRKFNDKRNVLISIDPRMEPVPTRVIFSELKAELIKCAPIPDFV